ncbi:MAG: ATP-binding protein, partial [Pirellulales bacterium]|nr:ATP-binding protein [Pirellulales bacterium]
GIPAHQRRKVFGRFVRLGNELERSRPGTGLGLYLVRNVTKAIGGSIRVAEREGKSGTRFEVTLPGVVLPAAISS